MAAIQSEESLLERHESFVPESVAGAGLEIAFEFEGGLFVQHGNEGDEFPPTESRGSCTSTGIVHGKAGRNVFRMTDVGLGGTT